MVTPLEDQRILAGRIVRHWTHGAGGDYNPKRREALEHIRISATLDEAVEAVGRQAGRKPRTVATCARHYPEAIGYGRLQRLMQNDHPHMILMGTAWGLAPEIIGAADHILASIGNHETYNHLSVRCAAAIILDRLTTPVGQPRD